MNITLHPTDDYLEIELNGRLDAAWADYVSSAIDEAVRGGSHRIALDLAAVTYISSMGIGVLLKHYNRLKAVQGKLVVIRPSPSTLTVIRTSGLADYLLVGDTVKPAAAVPAKTPVRTAEHGGAAYEIYTQVPDAVFDCTFHGEPAKFAAGGFSESDCRALDLPDGSIALGLGAFGDSFADCRPRFGEFLAAGGGAVTFPTAEEDVPDYVVTRGHLVPQVKTLYAIAATGRFASMLRFDAVAKGVVGLSQLIESALCLTTTDAACFAIVAEAGSVIGATLRRSPAGDAAGPPLDFPGVRDWLSFTTERSSERHLALIVGVASRHPAADAAAFLRPLTSGSPLQGHFHAAVFPYSPVQRGELTLATTVTQLLSASTPRSVTHLMADTRAFEGVGETELLRGACWVGAIGGMTRA